MSDYAQDPVVPEPTSAQRKLDWAIRHLERLRDEVGAYTNSNAYAFRADPERVSAQQIDFRCYATERQAPDPDWADDRA